MKTEKKILSTGEAAKILNVSQQTIIRFCDRGGLKNFRMPCGTRHRRIPIKSLIEFARESNMPFDFSRVPGRKEWNNFGEIITEDKEEGPIRVLIIDKKSGATSAVAGILENSDCEIHKAEDLFSAGAMAGRFRQDIILVGSAFAESLSVILKIFSGEPLKIVQRVEDNSFMDNYLKAAVKRRRQKKNRPQIMFCI